MGYLVTGGSGCIGSYVIRDLLLQGKKVINYDSDTSTAILRQVLPEEALRSLVMVRGDISDLPHLCRTLKTQEIEHVIHLASWQIPASNDNPSRALQIVAGGLVNVLEAARVLDLKKVLWASSIAVFGPPGEYTTRKLPNDAPHRPRSVYGACKSLGEFYLGYYHDQYGIDCSGFRFSAVYGVGREQGRSSFTTEMIRKVVAGEPYEVPFGDDVIDWQYVEDVSRLILRALEAGRTSTRVFNTRGDLRPVKEGVEYLRRLAPSAQLALLPGRFGIAWEFDTSVLESELGFYPEYKIEQGILKTLNGYRGQAGYSPL